MNARFKVAYSKTEARLLGLVRKKKQIDSLTLCDAYYSTYEIFRPWHAPSTINGAMRSLMQKIAHNGEPFYIKASERRGPHPLEYQYLDGAAARYARAAVAKNSKIEKKEKFG